MKRCKRWVPVVLIAVSLAAVAACKSVGRQFPFEALDLVVVGETTAQEVRKIFGPPFASGLDNGNLTWTYVNYYVSLFGQIDARDLKFEFDERNRVRSYSFNTSHPDDLDKVGQGEADAGQSE